MARNWRGLCPAVDCSGLMMIWTNSNGKLLKIGIITTKINILKKYLSLN
jgi:hypothetical protein